MKKTAKVNSPKDKKKEMNDREKKWIKINKKRLNKKARHSASESTEEMKAEKAVTKTEIFKKGNF